MDTQYSRPELDQHSERYPDTRRYRAAEVAEMAHDLSIELKSRFAFAVRYQLDKIAGLSSAVKDAAYREAHDTLLIELYDTPTLVQSRLADMGFDEAAREILPDEVLLTIRLPYPMEPKITPEDDAQAVIPWGHVYTNIVQTLWNVRNEFERDRDISIDRINPTGTHTAYEYYYLWLVYPRGRDKHFVEKMLQQDSAKHELYGADYEPMEAQSSE